MSFLLFIVVLVILIVVHELGHFFVAKWFGIRVDEFGIGYPPRAFTLGTFRKTTYTINWLPFGGFVRIFGESNNAAYSSQERKEAFVHKPRIVQAAVLFAGIAFNILFAWLLFSATLMLGAPTAIDEADAAGVPTRLIVSSVVVGSPASAAGIVPGDEIVALRADGESLGTLYPSAAAMFIQERGGEMLTLEYMRDAKTGETQSVRVTPAHGVLNESPGTPAIGMAMALVADQSLSLPAAMVEGFKNTVAAVYTVTVGLSTFLFAAVTGNADWSHVAGPIGIASLVGDASSVGLVYLLYFTACISVNLAIINLLPVPALDGGRLLFIAIEAIRRKPMSEKIANAVNVLGFTLLIVLMVVVTYHDIIRLFT